MEVPPKIVMVAGIPSAGKSTLAAQLAGCFGLSQGAVICTDYVYFGIARELGLLKGEKNFLPVQFWWADAQAKASALKEKHYASLLRPSGHTAIVEGVGLCNPHDRAIVMGIFKGYEPLLFYRLVNYEKWLERKGVVDCADRRAEYELLCLLVKLDNAIMVV